MSMSTVRVLGVAVLCAGMMSCVAIDAVDQGKERGALKIEPVAFKDAIPKEFGRALGVTVRAGYPDGAQLWFEKEDGTIVLINVDTKRGRLAEKILVIPRS
jgi:hypothetical protein